MVFEYQETHSHENWGTLDVERGMLKIWRSSSVVEGVVEPEYNVASALASLKLTRI
jgi:hypothetical protein